MDPSFFSALMDRHIESVKLLFRTTATLTAFYANAHLPQGQRVKPEDFVPGETEERGVPPEVEAAAWKRWAGLYAEKAD